MKKLCKKIIAITCMALTFVIASICAVVTYFNKPMIASAESGLGVFDVDLNMSYNDLRNNGADADGSRYLYLAIDGGSAIPYSGDGSNTTWDTLYTSVGDAVKVNGVAKNTQIVKTNADERSALSLYGNNGLIDLGCTNVGDTLTIDGEFTNATYGTFTVKDATFIFDGYSWMRAGTKEYTLDTSASDNVTPETGFYVSMEANELPIEAWVRPVKDDAYVLTRGNESTTFSGSLQKVDAGRWFVGFRNNSTGGLQGNALEGDVVTLGGWFYWTEDYTNYTFFKVKTTQYEYKDGEWKNITPVIEIKQNEETVSGNVVYVVPNTNVNTITVTASSGEVSAVYESGMVVNGEFVLRTGESISDYRITHYVEQQLGERSVYFIRETVLRVGFTDFVMEEGAAVRVTDKDVNGLRFTAEMSENTYNALQASDAKYGMVIVPRDYITEGYELTANNLFGVNAKYSEDAQVGAEQSVRRMLHLKNLTPNNYDSDSNYEIRGAITDILTSNITREFVGIAYAEVDGTYMLASYYGDDQENNARSIYYVAQKAIDANDNASALQEKYIDKFAEHVSEAGKTYNRTYTVNYITTVNGKSEVETETVSAPLNSAINLTAKEISGYKVSSASVINSKVYANKELVFNFYYTLEGAPVFDSLAWYHPPLDASNNYDNATNDGIAQTMKDAGFTMVLLGGRQNVAWDSAANVEAMRNIVDMFYRNGIKTILSVGNWLNTGDKYQLDYVPDFSNHEGFAGFFAWDEPLPTDEYLNAIATYAEWYKGVYADKEVPFMVNLNPSYSSLFNGSTEYGTLDYTTYPEYIKAYCDIVLSKFDGTSIQKFLSVDTYPIKSDGTLRENFLYDMAVLKAYAMESEAHMQVILQACGYGEGYDVAPTEEQLRLQLYTALAFGADNVAWYEYAPTSETIDAPLDLEGNPTDVYNSLQTVNNELATFGSLYKNYTWNGVIMSSPSKGFFGYGADAQYNAYQKVKDESVVQEYLLSASDTQSFSSISGSGSNYIVSVMQDKEGAEGFVAVNYSVIKDNKTLKLTFKANEQGNYAIYKNGAMETVEIGTSGYTLTLAPGEGAFIAVAKSDHTVTFKNWDGTVLQEETLSFGSVPEYKGATPTRERYKFTGWTPEIGAIYKDTVYTAMFDVAYTTYNTGDSIGQLSLSTPISMSALEGKAVHFEFKFASETGSFGFSLMQLDPWGTISSSKTTITKTDSGVTADAGRIIDLGDGWYAWELNKSAFTGSDAETATQIDFIYGRGTVDGTLYIDPASAEIVDAYTSRDVATKYENGSKLNGGANYVLSNPISMTELSGKALRFEFKFESETGSFAFSLLQYSPWTALTNIVTITKTESGFTVTDNGTNKDCGRIVDAGDGWYAWEINATDFPGSGVATAQVIDLIVPRNTVVGTLYLNLDSMTIVDAYEVDSRLETATKYENGSTLNGGANYVLSNPISMTELSGKALRWEFKFESETGSFAFSLLQYSPWTALTNIVTITKTESGFTVMDNGTNQTCGRIVDAGNGWYAWEINATDFPGSGATTAQVIDLIVPRNTVVGTLYLNLDGMTIVDEYDGRDGRATKMEAGASAKQIYFKNNTQIAITDLVGKAIQVDFKPADDSEGELFRFSLHATAWNNMTGTVVITRSGNTITANQGIVVESGNGWYSWQLCHALFMGDGSNKPNATNVAFLYTGTITRAVYIDGVGVKVVDAYDKTPYATQFSQGDTLSTVTAKLVINKSDWNNTWSGFNLYLEFKFENAGDGELFRFGVCANDASWSNVTATIVISKNGDEVTANRGQVIALEDGWYAWVVSADAFEGDGAAAATNITYIAAAGQPIAAEKVWILPYLKAIPVS